MYDQCIAGKVTTDEEMVLKDINDRRGVNGLVTTGGTSRTGTCRGDLIPVGAIEYDSFVHTISKGNRATGTEIKLYMADLCDGTTARCEETSETSGHLRPAGKCI